MAENNIASYSQISKCANPPREFIFFSFIFCKTRMPIPNSQGDFET